MSHLCVFGAPNPQPQIPQSSFSPDSISTPQGLCGTDRGCGGGSPASAPVRRMPARDGTNGAANRGAAIRFRLVCMGIGAGAWGSGDDEVGGGRLGPRQLGPEWVDGAPRHTRCGPARPFRVTGRHIWRSERRQPGIPGPRSSSSGASGRLKRLCCGRVQHARAPRYAGPSLRRTPVGTGHRRHRRPSARDASDRAPAENISLRSCIALSLPMARISLARTSRPAAKLVSPRTEASASRGRIASMPACAGAPPHRRGRGQFGGRDGRGAGDADRHRGAGCRTGACARAHKGACVREGGREEREERKNSCWVWN